MLLRLTMNQTYCYYNAQYYQAQYNYYNNTKSVYTKNEAYTSAVSKITFTSARGANINFLYHFTAYNTFYIAHSIFTEGGRWPPPPPLGTPLNHIMHYTCSCQKIEIYRKCPTLSPTCNKNDCFDDRIFYVCMKSASYIGLYW